MNYFYMTLCTETFCFAWRCWRFFVVQTFLEIGSISVIVLLDLRFPGCCLIGGYACRRNFANALNIEFSLKLFLKNLIFRFHIKLSLRRTNFCFLLVLCLLCCFYEFRTIMLKHILMAQGFLLWNAVDIRSTVMPLSSAGISLVLIVKWTKVQPK